VIRRPTDFARRRSGGLNRQQQTAADDVAIRTADDESEAEDLV